MQVIAYFDVAPEHGESPIQVRDRVGRILKDAGLETTQIGVVAEEVVEPVKAHAVKHPVKRRVYDSSLYPGTDEVHEFYIEKHLS